ncbi:MAG TPA: polyprenyl synthetase family protein [Cytophagaceae bacterium]|jgi:geranylgeranyl diphosphate synthase type II|nr:polyprenyl synthetase family protein [Cytophagaceae bacterium]
MLLNLNNIVKRINKEIAQFNFGNEPKELYEPIRYSMESTGKRLRPLLTIWGTYLFSDDLEQAYQPAIAIEVFHNFTLMHDDIMDNAPLRRGRETVHTKWNPNIAILSGDVMLVKVYDFLSKVEETKIKRVISSFNACASKVCEGQQRDMNFETQAVVSEEDYLKMIRNKTAVLLGYSLELGALISGADDKNIQLLREAGESIGVGFQLKDDLLDVYGDEKNFGKKKAGDIAANKKTFLLIKAMEAASDKDKKILKNLYSSSNTKEEEKIRQVMAIYDKLEIRAITEKKIDEYFKDGLKKISAVEASLYKKARLKDFIKELITREK